MFWHFPWVKWLIKFLKILRRIIDKRSTNMSQYVPDILTSLTRLKSWCQSFRLSFFSVHFIHNLHVLQHAKFILSQFLHMNCAHDKLFSHAFSPEESQDCPLQPIFEIFGYKNGFSATSDRIFLIRYVVSKKLFELHIRNTS